MFSVRTYLKHADIVHTQPETLLSFLFLDERLNKCHIELFLELVLVAQEQEKPNVTEKVLASRFNTTRKQIYLWKKKLKKCGYLKWEVMEKKSWFVLSLSKKKEGNYKEKYERQIGSGPSMSAKSFVSLSDSISPAKRFFFYLAIRKPTCLIISFILNNLEWS